MTERSAGQIFFFNIGSVTKKRRRFSEKPSPKEYSVLYLVKIKSVKCDAVDLKIPFDCLFVALMGSCVRLIVIADKLSEGVRIVCTDGLKVDPGSIDLEAVNHKVKHTS